MCVSSSHIIWIFRIFLRARKWNLPYRCRRRAEALRNMRDNDEISREWESEKYNVCVLGLACARFETIYLTFEYYIYARNLFIRSGHLGLDFVFNFKANKRNVRALRANLVTVGLLIRFSYIYVYRQLW